MAGRFMVNPSTIIETLTGLVIFEIDISEFCVDIKDVAAILNPNELDKFEEIYDQKSSKLMLENMDIPIVDLHNYFELPKHEIMRDTRLLLLEFNNKKFGFFVERIKEIITVDKEFKNDILKFYPDDKGEYLIGTLKYEGKSLAMPDYLKILSETHSK
jgi:chemotaxis signal transduction protein